MNALPQIMVTGLTLGALYAVATLGLSLIWASLRFLNLAHGAMLAVGGYAAFAVATNFGLSGPLAFLAAMAFGALMGWATFWGLVRPILDTRDFETNILIVTIGLSIILENGLLQIFGGQPYGQPVSVPGALALAGIRFPIQNMVIVLSAITIVLAVSLLLRWTRIGLALRACAQDRDAAALMGLPVTALFSATMALAGALTAASGVMISSITQLSPLLGDDPMLKAFIMCVLAGLGNIGGAIASAFLLAIVEVMAEFYFASRWGFPTLLFLVIAVLIWKPNGLFSGREVQRL
jgi:branched-chain amino acid transport system permease protein